MILSHKHKFLFIKTRKTAGSTLEKLLYPYLGERDVITGSIRDETPTKNVPSKGGKTKYMDHTPGRMQHMSYKQAKNSFLIDKDPNDYFKFSIERNPWDKVVSSYFWHSKIKPQRTEKGFEHYVLNCELVPNDWGYYTNNKGELVVDKLYKYEEINEMYEDLNDRFGFGITKQDIQNVRMKGGLRKVRDYRELHTPKTIKFVESKYKKIIRLMGYTYE